MENVTLLRTLLILIIFSTFVYLLIAILIDNENIAKREL